MPRLFVTNRQGGTSEIHAESSRTLMEVLRDEGFEIAALCGGCCSCATCHVYVDPACTGKLPAISEDEDCLLENCTQRIPESSRLSCQIRLTEQLDGLRLTLAPEE